MDFQFAIVCYFATSLVNVRGIIFPIADVCSDYVSTKNVEDDGLFEIYTFEAEEGPLKIPSKIIGEVTWLLDNSTTAYSFDEPFFNGTLKRKTKPRPPLFDVIFRNFTINETTTTPGTPQLSTTASPPRKELFLLSSASDISVLNDSATQAFTSNLALFETGSESDEPVKCAKAQILQIHDLDREESGTHYLTLSDGEKYTVTVAKIKVTDINDNSPVFVKESLTARIPKDVNHGEVVAELKATDADIGKNADLRYEMLNFTERRGNETESPPVPTFTVHRKLGLVVLSGSLDDLEPNTNITFNVSVKDRGDEPDGNLATATVTICITNNTQIAKDPSKKTGQITQPLKCVDYASDDKVENDGLFSVHTFKAEEGILLISSKIIGEIVLPVYNTSNGHSFDEPFFKKPYNTKSKPRPSYFDVAFSNTSRNEFTTTPSTLPSTAAVTAVPKQFSLLSFTDNFSELKNPYMTSSGGLETSNDNNSISYNGSTQVTPIATSPVTSAELVKPTDCVKVQIIQIFDLDREESDTHFLTLSDVSGQGQFTIVQIQVTDINDNSPVFVKESLSTQITKDVQYGTIVAEIKATDADIGKNADLRYEIIYPTERRGNATESPPMPTFMIHEKLGLVVLTGSIDDLKPNTPITFSVTVKDRGDEYPSNRATSTATITVIDDSWMPEVPSKKKISDAVIAGSVMGAVAFIGIVVFIGLWYRRRHAQQRQEGQLAFMLDDENLISA